MEKRGREKIFPIELVECELQKHSIPLLFPFYLSDCFLRKSLLEIRTGFPPESMFPFNFRVFRNRKTSPVPVSF